MEETMICCEAPAWADTRRHDMEIVDYVERDEYVASDVRGGLFPTVFKYERRQHRQPVFGTKVAHTWIDPATGQQAGMWHWED